MYFQFLILLIVLPIIAVLALKDAGAIQTVLTQVPATQLQIVNHPNSSFYLVFFLSKIAFQFPMIDPALIQRFLMARSKRQLRRQFLALATFSPALYLTIMLMGLAGLVLYPDLQGHAVVPHMVNNILPCRDQGRSHCRALGRDYGYY